MIADPEVLARLEDQLAQARNDWSRVVDAGAPRATVDAALDRVQQARAALLDALGQPLPEAATATLPATLTGHLFGAAGAALDRVAAGKALSSKQVGVCLSGGGTRAASCSMGALRALRSLRLLDRVQYLSTVSGGGWAGSIYMYSQRSLDETLGPDLPVDGVSKLRWSSGAAPFNLGSLGRYAIGSMCTQIGWEALINGAVDLYWNYGSRLSSHAYWPRLIGQLVLGPYDLGDHRDANGAPTRYYSGAEGLFPVAIGKYNPGLSKSSFYFARDDRPWWVANATMSAPAIHPVPYPFWQSELSVGVFPSFPGQGIGGANIGGGSIDPFTAGSQSPQRYGEGFFTVGTPPGQYALSDVAGTSSAALSVELFSRLPSWLKSIVGDLTPEYPYWPPSAPNQGAQTYEFSDGASLDNSAVCGLLGWAGPDAVLSFVNTSVPTVVVNGHLPFGSIDAVNMDSSIPALFGWIWDAGLRRYRRTTPSDGNPWYVQAFQPGDFVQLVDGLRAAIGQGSAATARLKATTVTNARFGITAGRSIDIMFLFNYQAPKFWNQIEWGIKLELDVRYPLVTFPYYDTVRDLNLDAQSVNLLADLMAWSVQTNESAIRSMFGPIT